MNYTIQNFISDLEVAFPRFGQKDEVAERRWSELIGRKLKHYKGHILKDAAEDMITHRTTKSFPSLAEMLKACDKWLPRDDASTAELQAWQKYDDCDKYREDEAYWAKCLDHADKSPIFAQSVSENWHSALRVFMMRERRLPNEAERQTCRQEARLFLEAYESCVRGDGDINNVGALKKLHFPAKSLEALGDSMLARREELRETIIGQRSHK